MAEIKGDNGISKRNDIILVFWDFDNSFIDANSDYYPLDILSKSNKKEKLNPIWLKMKQDSIKKNITIFTEFQDTYMWYVM